VFDMVGNLAQRGSDARRLGWVSLVTSALRRVISLLRMVT
jgi:hypothetical protein